jgi:hypothetical protein
MGDAADAFMDEELDRSIRKFMSPAQREREATILAADAEAQRQFDAEDEEQRKANNADK